MYLIRKMKVTFLFQSHHMLTTVEQNAWLKFMRHACYKTSMTQLQYFTEP